VVTRDVPPYAVAVGVPARKIKDRFPEKLAAAMMRIAWWDWPYETIKDRLSDFCGSAEDFARAYDGAGAA